MANREIAQQLARVPLFSGCTKRELAEMASAAKEVHHEAGHVIAREGDRGIGFFLITDGTAKVTRGGKHLARLGPGDFFGEVALLDRGTRTATVTATSPITVVGITAWGFRGLLEKNPGIALKLLEVVAGRLRAATKDPVA